MGEVKSTCPFCHKPKHLYINPEKEVFHCFRCKKSGRLADLPGSLIPLYSHQAQASIKSKVDKSKLIPISEKDSMFWEYAEKRNALKFKDNLFKWPQYPNYLVIGYPLLENFKNLNFFFGRRILLTGPRYRYFQSQKGIIGKSFIGQVEEALLVEGFFDLCVGSDFIPTIAVMGKDWDDIKLDKIKSSVTKKVQVALDRDALRESIELAEKLANRGLEVKVTGISVIKDLGELDKTFSLNIGRTAW